MKAIVLDGYTLNPGDNPWTGLEQLCDLIVYNTTLPTDVVERCRDADIVLTNKVPVDGDAIRSLPQLKLIGVLATGFNVVDIEAARIAQIPVSNVPAYSTDSVAQHVMAMILAWASRVESHAESTRAGDWSSCDHFCYQIAPLTELTDKVMGVVGFGRIGRRVAELASAFRMNVLAYTPHPARHERIAGERFDWCPLEQVFRESDFVSLHCPLTDTNAQFVNAELVAKMKPGAVLINTARGGLLNESDVAAALHSGQLGAALLDVLSTEPPSAGNVLLDAPNCLVTPHIAWSTREARQRLMKTVVDNVEAFLGGKAINVVNDVS